MSTSSDNGTVSVQESRKQMRARILREQREAEERLGHPVCGAKTRKGGKACRSPAGHGTPFRTGRCSKHCGNTPSHRLHSEREQARELAVQALGSVMSIDPLSAQELSTALSRGLVEHWRGKLIAEGERPSANTLAAFRQAVSDLSRISGRAIDSRVAERQVAIVERQAEEVIAVCEAGLIAMQNAGLFISNEYRTAFAAGVQTAIEAREGDEEDVIDATVVELPVGGR